MRNIRRIVVHCTGTGSGVPPQAIAAHFARMGWRVGGYHYVIDWQGCVTNPVPEEQVANGVRGYNQESIHVAYIGGVDDLGRPKDTRNDAQRYTLRALVRQLLWRYPDAVVVGHRDLSPDADGDGRITSRDWIKQCPCFDVATEL